MNRIVIIAASFVAASFAIPAPAQSPSERTQVVSYADLDLSREADVRKLDRRIGRAIKEVCGTASDADVEGKNEVRRCRIVTRDSLAAERGRALASVTRPTQVAVASER